MTHTRGQAALEFLTTYGWAFLVILVMIGALAYFGVINPDKFLPERCTFPTELPCRDQQVVGAGADNAVVNFYLSNNLGQSITLNGINAKYIDGTSSVVCGISAATVDAGSEFNVTCGAVPRGGGNNYPSVGGKVKFVVNGTYQPSQGVYTKTFSGEIYSKIQ